MVSRRRKIIWTRGAQSDAKEVLDFYTKRNGSTRYSISLKNEFITALKRVAILPLSGHATEYPHVRMSATL